MSRLRECFPGDVTGTDLAHADMPNKKSAGAGSCIKQFSWPKHERSASLFPTTGVKLKTIPHTFILERKNNKFTPLYLEARLLSTKMGFHH